MICEFLRIFPISINGSFFFAVYFHALLIRLEIAIPKRFGSALIIISGFIIIFIFSLLFNFCKSSIIDSARLLKLILFDSIACLDTLDNLNRSFISLIIFEEVTLMTFK